MLGTTLAHTLAASKGPLLFDRLWLQGFYQNASSSQCHLCPKSASCCYCDPKEVRPMAQYLPEQTFRPCKECLRGVWPVPEPGVPPPGSFMPHFPLWCAGTASQIATSC